MIEYYKDSSPVLGPEDQCQSVKMDPVNVSGISCNFTAHFSGNSSSCAQSNWHPSFAIPNPYEEFFKFAFGSAIYILTVLLITIMANGLLLLVFFFDPLKIFRNATTYFLVGLAVVDILTAATQEPVYATCFIMMYTRHPDTRCTCPKLLSVGQTISIASMICSFLIVLAFTFTQYVVVISPLNYTQNVTKRRVIICVLAIYVYSVLFSVLPEMRVSEDAQRKIDNTFHSICLIYFTVIIYSLLFTAFKKKMAASKSLREDKKTNDGSKDDRRTDVERKFITVNFLLIAILFLTTLQPAAMFWIAIAKLYSSEDPNSPKFLIINLMVDNLLYLKFLLDPFVYAWRIPKYRQALMIVFRCGKEKPERSKFSNRVIAVMSRSGETVITLDFKQISNF